MAQVVLEEVLTAAIDSALEAGKRANQDRFEDGLLVAYYGVITRAQTQARLMGVEFCDRSLAAFDADKELIAGRNRVA